jgi:ferritin-like metal-binding protein YciE
VIIAAGQRAEHYEIAAYGTAIAWAEALELPEVAEVLTETLEEEKAADEKLSALAEAGINEAATAEASDDESDEDMGTAANEPERVGALGRSAKRRAK